MAIEVVFQVCLSQAKMHSEVPIGAYQRQNEISIRCIYIFVLKLFRLQFKLAPKNNRFWNAHDAVNYLVMQFVSQPKPTFQRGTRPQTSADSTERSSLQKKNCEKTKRFLSIIIYFSYFISMSNSFKTENRTFVLFPFVTDTSIHK